MLDMKVTYLQGKLYVFYLSTLNYISTSCSNATFSILVSFLNLTLNISVNNGSFVELL